MNDKDTKQYKKIFNNKKLSWAEKIEKAGEYANDRISLRLTVEEFSRNMNKMINQGIVPVNLN